MVVFQITSELMCTLPSKTKQHHHLLVQFLNPFIAPIRLYRETTKHWGFKNGDNASLPKAMHCTPLKLPTSLKPGIRKLFWSPDFYTELYLLLRISSYDKLTTFPTLFKFHFFHIEVIFSSCSQTPLSCFCCFDQ